jgi:deoxyribodipyrimidine photo-lyase
MVPDIRIRAVNSAPLRADHDYVLYWMIAFRRTEWNFSLDRAVEWSRELRKPLLIFEPLRVGYRWASDRIHRFVIDGMADNASRMRGLRNRGIYYFPYVEPHFDADKGLLAALAERACVVVTDDFPSFFLPRMVAAAGSHLKVRLEQVDSNGLLPLRATDRVFTTAHSFRRYLQKEITKHLEHSPESDPLQQLSLPVMPKLPVSLTRRWPAAAAKLLAGDKAELAALPIDHTTKVVATSGGAQAARKKLKLFLQQKLKKYVEDGNDPDRNVRSELSPYLHFGHLSSHEMFDVLMSRMKWSMRRVAKKASGQREGWWRAGANAEAWLDQFVTWRELGYNMSAQREDYDQYESLPEWSVATLEKHASDPREFIYELDEFAAAQTHDPLWNAAQVQLLREGQIHNYLRMLWGKKILEWSATPRDALNVMIELNNRYALDGRNPNSYSGIFWCLGRYDRPWGPERPIFGKVRYMSSENTRRKLRLKEYLQKYGARTP